MNNREIVYIGLTVLAIVCISVLVAVLMKKGKISELFQRMRTAPREYPGWAPDPRFSDTRQTTSKFNVISPRQYLDYKIFERCNGECCDGHPATEEHNGFSCARGCRVMGNTPW